MKQILDLDGFNTYMYQTTNEKTIIKIVLACDIPKKENVEQFLYFFKKHILDIENFHLLLECEDMPVYPLNFFNMISNTLTEEKERVQDNLNMTGIIVHSIMGKMMLDAFLRIYTPIRPLRIVKDENDFINLESCN